MSRFLSFCVKADREMFHKYTKALPACYNYCQIQEPDPRNHKGHPLHGLPQHDPERTIATGRILIHGQSRPADNSHAESTRTIRTN